MNRTLVTVGSSVALVLTLALALSLLWGADAGAAEAGSSGEPEKIYLKRPEGTDLFSKVLAPSVMVPRSRGAKEEKTRSAASSSRLIPEDERPEGVVLPAPVATTGYGYRLDLEPAWLRVGVPFYTAEPAALIAFEGLEASQVEFLVDDRVIAGPDALEALPTAEASSALPAAPAWRLRSELGFGKFKVRAAPEENGEPLALYMAEPGSSILLQLSLPRSHFVHGQILQGFLRMVEHGEGEDTPLSTLKAEATLTVPGNDARPVRLLKHSSGGYTVRMPLDVSNTEMGEDWILQAQTVGMHNGQQVIRSASIPFKVAFASAQLRDPAVVSRDSGKGLTISFPVEVSAAGRFALSAVLYGGKGETQPLAEARSEAWLDAGKRSLVLVFGPELFTGPDLEDLPEGPLEIRDLLLEDVSRNSVVQAQAFAFAVGSD